MSTATTTQATTLDTMSVDKAEAIVRDHGHLTMRVDGVLMGGIDYRTLDGLCGRDWTPVPLNTRDLRDWLGY